MRLREQLDQLGQMKGITQDEKGEEQDASGVWLLHSQKSTGYSFQLFLV